MTSNVLASPLSEAILFSEAIQFQNAYKELGYNLESEIWDRKLDILTGLEDNIKALSKKARTHNENIESENTDSNFISKERIIDSLLAFRKLILLADSKEDLRRGLEENFVLYRSKGHDGQGNVSFTGYYQPTFKASRKRNALHKYPIYRTPDTFNKWPNPHPKRIQLEGYDGLGNCGTCLKGLEIAWLKSRYDVFMIHLQGSAILEMLDGEKVAVGFAAGTNHRFNGIPKNFLSEKKISWANLKQYFDNNKDEFNAIISRNNRFIFFNEKKDPSPIGSLGVPVIPQLSIATDKTILPVGALGIIQTRLPVQASNGKLTNIKQTKLVLDQDTGSAIKGAGRVDIFMGTGNEAHQLASSVYSKGALYYLITRES
jgi:membrane-bound lytic murein transglycosylase A